MLALVRASRNGAAALWLLFALVLFIADEHGVLGTYGSGATFSSAGTGGTDGGQVTEHDAGVELLFFGLFLHILSLRNTTLYLLIMLLIQSVSRIKKP